MAKELPYFKFEPNQWESGNVQICTLEEKGLFIEICSLYWSRLGSLPVKLVLRKICNGNATAFNSLIEENILIVKDGFICIDFLNEQLIDFDNLSKTNSENARKGWEKRKENATAKRNENERNAIREEKRREEKMKKEKMKEEKSLVAKKTEKVFSGEVEDCFIQCLNFFPEHLRPKEKSANEENWKNSIRLLNESEKIPFPKIIQIVKSARNDDFWKKQFLSLPKLRSKNKDNIKYIVVFNEKFKSNSKTDAEEFTDILEKNKSNPIATGFRFK